MSEHYDAFAAALVGGADCAELHQLRAQIRLGTEHAQAIQDLRRIGCYSAKSVRRDEGYANEQYGGHDYRLCYESVAWRLGDVYAGAGTRDVDQAARWYAGGFTGVVAEAAYVACLDALNGRPPRH